MPPIRRTRTQRQQELAAWWDSLPYVEFHGSLAGCLSLWKDSRLRYEPHATDPWGYTVPAAGGFPEKIHTLNQPFDYDGSSTSVFAALKNFHPLKAQPESLQHDEGWVYKHLNFDHNNWIFAAIFKTHKERGFTYTTPSGDSCVEKLDLPLATIKSYYMAVSIGRMRRKWERQLGAEQ